MAKKQKGAPKKGLTNVIREYNVARLGLDMDSSEAQIAKGKLSYALNAVVENFDANSINYQNEPGNIECLYFPDDYILIGRYFINEQAKHIFFLVNPLTGNSQIGYMVNNDCEYHIIVSNPCLGFSVNFPIHKVVHRITNCTTEIYWADNVARRWLDIDNVPYKLLSGTAICDPVYSTILDCNQLKVQPNFSIPGLTVTDVRTGGALISGTYQFAIQYSDASGSPLTAYYSVTNPCPMNDPFTVSVNFDTPVGKSIVVSVDNLDISGLYGYFNLVVISTINNITKSELIATFSITGEERDITYTGATSDLIQVSMNEIFEKFPYYEQADDLTAVRDVLVWKGLTTIDRINYQNIANQISLEWETYRIPDTETYRDELNATNLRSYLRDEVYPFEVVFLLTNGRQTDKFHIPGRVSVPADLPNVSATDPDYIGDPDDFTQPRWKIYNTATVIGDSLGKTTDIDYKGPWNYGEMGYIESEELYPCNDGLWGDLAGLPIRHHKFPDVLVSPINESTLFTSEANMVMENNAVFPIGIKMSMVQITDLIAASTLPQDQKDEIVGIKIVRGDRGTNKSIIGKGILRNVGKYSREGQEYYFPNYPYNDLTEDPFLTSTNNAWADSCGEYIVTITSITGPGGIATIKSVSCGTNKTVETEYNSIGAYEVCSVGFPVILGGNGDVTASVYDLWKFESEGAFCPGWRVEWIDSSGEVQREWIDGALGGGNRLRIEDVLLGTEPQCVDNCDKCGRTNAYQETIDNSFECPPALPVDPIGDEEPYRLIFNSPETSFGQPFLGATLKLESLLFGKGTAHFVEVKDNAKYRLLSIEAQEDAVESAIVLGDITNPFNPQAFFTAYEAYLEIYLRTVTRKNFGYNYNSIASYNYNAEIPNDLGIKQRTLDIFRYLIPGVQAVGEGETINNFQRESSVYLKTKSTIAALPFPKDTPNIPVGFEDKSRVTISSAGICQNHLGDVDITVASYYASLKNLLPNQWGQIYSYRTVDTGFQEMLDSGRDLVTIFGGDTFINRFAFKTKLPFFIDNRVNGQDDSDIFYDEIGNVAYPKYWHSARSIHQDVVIPDVGVLPNFLSYKAHNFDCPNDQTVIPPAPPDSNPDRLFYDGFFYMFAYGIPSFYCESSYNVDLRQAFNNKEGDYWPHVSTSIPDDWMQESFVSIANDNTYTYNVTYSKQNKENSFSVLPPDWTDKICSTQFPFRAVYSDVQSDDQSTNRNNWLIYRAVSYFDFPQNFGKFVSIDGIADSAVLARFENKTLIYNSLITIDTSNPQAAYIGNSKLFSEAPPIDFADTDLGFIGTQNKMLLKIPNGQITIDAKRGHIFLLNGQKVEVISKYGSGMNSFLKEHLPFKMLKYFPETKATDGIEIITIPGINVDNNFKGVGLHGVYDSRFERVIITKLDYEPLFEEISLNPYTQEFSYEGAIVELTNPKYFCNKSWTLSYNLNTNSWISFHSYIPNFYIAENNHFYTGLYDTPSLIFSTKPSIWAHLTDHTIYNSYYGQTKPFVIEYPFTYESGMDEILQGVSSYNKVYKYFNSGLSISDRNNRIQTDHDWFNKSVIYNGQQCSGVLELVHKPSNNMKEYMSYPKYNVASKTIIWSKDDGMYSYNTFWDTIVTLNEPLFLTSCESLSVDKVLNQDNRDYGPRSFKKATIRAKDVKIRLILDNKNDIAIVTQFILAPAQISYS